MLASDVNNPQFVGAMNPDDVLHIRFYTKTIQNNYETERQGRPIFFDAPYVEIMTPGNQLSIIDTPVREEHKIRFPKQWAVFQSSENKDQIVGMPVEQCPFITKAEAEELRAIKFFTVEQIALASDQQIQRLGMSAHGMRQKALAFLAKTKNTGLEDKLASDNARKDQEIAELKASMQEIIEQMKKNAKEIKQKRKYTKRIKPEVQPEQTA